MIRLLVLPFFAVSPWVWAATFDPFEGAKPVAALIQSDPWAMVMGADTPRVVAYDDRTIIFSKKTGTNATYQMRQLSEMEMSDFKKHLAPVVSLKDLKTFYNLRPNTHDLPAAMFYVRDGERESVVRAYGLMAPGTKLTAYTTRPKSREPDQLPREVLELHQFLCSVDYPDSNEWTPQYVEVIIWPYDYAPEESIHWPKDWPRLDSVRSKKHGDSYSIFMDGGLLSEIRRFLRTRNARGAVEIDGKKWAASVRAVFPSEPVWREAFQKARGK